MTKRPSIPRLALGKLAWAAYIIVLVGLVAVFVIVSYQRAQERSIGWEHVSGGLYRRADCDTGVFIYREAGSFGQVEIEHAPMSQLQFDTLCRGGKR